MKVKTNKLTGVALNYAVAVALGGTHLFHDTVATWWIKINGGHRALAKGWAQSFTPDTDWSEGGPIIERERLLLKPVLQHWVAYTYNQDDWQMGPTPLIAGMRCFVASKLGDEVGIPEELLP